jgi:hypothetical protein
MQQLPQAESVHPCQQSQHHEDEEPARHVEREHQHGQRADRLEAVAAHGERHGAERAQRGRLHQDAECREQDVGKRVDPIDHQLPRLADAGQREADDDGEEQDRQHFTLGEGAEKRQRDDVQEEFAEAQGSGLLGELLHSRLIDRGGIDVHADARPHQHDRDKANH